MDDMRDTFTKLTKTITKASGELIKTTKLSVELQNEEASLKNIYLNIGKKVHEIYTYGGSLGPFFDEQYAEIKAAEKKIREYRERLDALKNVKTVSAPINSEVSQPEVKPMTKKVCSLCGAENEAGDRFCLSCGRIL